MLEPARGAALRGCTTVTDERRGHPGEILTIGDELLLGELDDTNAARIAERLREDGVAMQRITTVGDREHDIAEAVSTAAQRARIVVCTGGLGPTVDDLTRQGVASAARVELEWHPELWSDVRAMFARFDKEPSDNNRRQAELPRGAIPIRNPVGTAPAFAVHIGGALVVALPGVPREMLHLLEDPVRGMIREHLGISDAFAIRVVRTAGVGESQIDQEIGDLMRRPVPRIGLAAHMGAVDVRISARAESRAAAEAIVEDAEREVRRRLDRWAYGTDDDTLAEVALQSVADHRWRFVAVEAGLGGRLARALAEAGDLVHRVTVVPSALDARDLAKRVADERSATDADVVLGVALDPPALEGPEDPTADNAAGSAPTAHVIVRTPTGEHSRTLPAPGARRLAPRRAIAAALDLLRHA